MNRKFQIFINFLPPEGRARAQKQGRVLAKNSESSCCCRHTRTQPAGGQPEQLPLLTSISDNGGRWQPHRPPEVARAIFSRCPGSGLGIWEADLYWPSATAPPAAKAWPPAVTTSAFRAHEPYAGSPARPSSLLTCLGAGKSVSRGSLHRMRMLCAVRRPHT